MTACTHCGDHVEPRVRVTGVASTAMWLPVDNRGWCSGCVWDESTPLGCSRCEVRPATTRGMCESCDEFMLDSYADHARGDDL